MSLPPQPLAHALARHETHRARHVGEVRAVELRTDAMVERRARERKRASLGRVEDEPAERRHRVRARAIAAHELQVDGLCDEGRQRVVASTRTDPTAPLLFLRPKSRAPSPRWSITRRTTCARYCGVLSSK